MEGYNHQLFQQNCDRLIYMANSKGTVVSFVDQLVIESEIL